MRQRETERLAHHLGCRRGAEELTAAARRPAGAAAQLGRALQGHLTLGKARAQALHSPGVFAVLRRQRDAAGHEHAGQIAHGGQRHHHGGQALVASGDPEHALARGQRADEPAKDHGGVVAIGQAVHHSRRPLRAAVAGIGDEGREGQALEPLELGGGGLHQQAHFPVPRVISQRDGMAVGSAHAALGGEHEELGTSELARIPAHTRVLRQPEEISARPLEQHLAGEGQAAARSRARRLDGPQLS